jgi:hypothetical protein
MEARPSALSERNDGRDTVSSDVLVCSPLFPAIIVSASRQSWSLNTAQIYAAFRQLSEEQDQLLRRVGSYA